MDRYVVTDSAPPEIYGRDVKPGETLTLTKRQAEHLLSKGQIALPEAAEPVEKASEDPLAEAERTAKPKGRASGDRN